MASDKKTDLEGFSVDKNNVCRAEGGFVGNVTGVASGGLGDYVLTGTIDASKSVAIIGAEDATPVTMALPDGTVYGQRIVIVADDVSGVLTVTSSNIGGGSTITYGSAGQVTDLAWSGQWEVLFNSGTLS